MINGLEMSDSAFEAKVVGDLRAAPWSPLQKPQNSDLGLRQASCTFTTPGIWGVDRQFNQNVGTLFVC